MKLRKVPVFCALALVAGFSGEAHCSRLVSNSFVPAAFAQAGKKDLPPCLAEIAKATVIEDGSLPSAKLKGHLIDAQKLGPTAKDMIVQMIQTATPAGRLISLALLKKIDAGEYQKQAAELKQQLGDQSVAYVSLSERCHYSVSDILNDMAAKQPLIKLLPEPAAK